MQNRADFPGKHKECPSTTGKRRHKTGTHQTVIDGFPAPLVNKLGVHTRHAFSRFARACSHGLGEHIVGTFQCVHEVSAREVIGEVACGSKLDCSGESGEGVPKEGV